MDQRKVQAIRGALKAAMAATDVAVVTARAAADNPKSTLDELAAAKRTLEHSVVQLDVAAAAYLNSMN